MTNHCQSGIYKHTTKHQVISYYRRCQIKLCKTHTNEVENEFLQI